MNERLAAFRFSLLTERCDVSGFWRLMLFGKGPREAALPGRDLRIDAIRGLTLLIIFVNHMPGNVVSAWMPHNYGFSDAADIFVLLAGVSAAFAYGRLIDQRGMLRADPFALDRFPSLVVALAVVVRHLVRGEQQILIAYRGRRGATGDGLGQRLGRGRRWQPAGSARRG